MSYQSKEQKAIVRARAEEALANYSSGNGTCSDGWNILRYYRQGYYVITNTLHFADVVRPEYGLLRAAKAGDLEMSSLDAE